MYIYLYLLTYIQVVNGITRACNNDDFSDDEAMEEDVNPYDFKMGGDDNSGISIGGGFGFGFGGNNSFEAATSRPDSKSSASLAIESKNAMETGASTSGSRPSTPRTTGDRDDIAFTYSNTLNEETPQPPLKQRKTEQEHEENDEKVAI